MTMIVNNQPAQPPQKDTGMGFVLGMVLLIIVVVLLIYYGGILIRGIGSRSQVTIPSNVNVNIHTNQK